MQKEEVVAMLERIKTLMSEKKISQYRLIQDKVVNGSTFSKWDKGVHKPSIDMLIELSNIFDVSIDYLVGKTDKREVNR